MSKKSIINIVIFIVIILVSLFWYAFIRNSILSNGNSTCSCPVSSYHGPSFPDLFPKGGCGTCGVPISPIQFLLNLLVIAAPGFIILIFYIVILYIVNNSRRFKSPQV